MQGGSRSLEHDGVEFLTAWRTGGGKVEFFNMLPLALFVGGYALRAVELIDGGLAVISRGVFRTGCLVFELFQVGIRGDGFSAVCVAISFIRGIVLMVAV